MTKTNKILIAILSVLLLLLAAIGAVIAYQSDFFGSRGNIAQPYNETRYSGTIENAEGLTDDAVPVVLVIRFHDDGETGELTSPTLKRHSTLTKTGEHTYREEIVHGEGDSGVEWTFEPGDDESMSASYTTPDGASASADLPQTNAADTSGEVGLNPKAPGAEPDGIEFPSDGVREIATIEWTDKNDPENNRTETAIFRGSRKANVFTVTYPERGCYGVLEHIDNVTKEEKISVGNCESGGTWHLTDGDEKKGEAEFTSADKSLTGKLTYEASEWKDIEGEIGLARSGPVLDFYREVTDGAYGSEKADEAEAKKPEKNGEEGNLSREARTIGSMTPWGYGDLTIGMSQDEAINNGLDEDSIEPAELDVKGCTIGTYQKRGFEEAQVFLDNGVITAISRNGGGAYFDNQPIDPWQPGDDFDNVVPGQKPTVEKKGEWDTHNWKLEGGKDNILHIRLFAAESQTMYFAYTPDSDCTPLS